MADKAQTTFSRRYRCSQFSSLSVGVSHDVESESAGAENFVTSLTCVSLKVSYFTDDAVQKFRSYVIQANESKRDFTTFFYRPSRLLLVEIAQSSN